ncbi:MAG TPA: phosphopantetheine-binding protein [Candidatus Cybelea sp.]|nr:phosphopantetheine-binding protein [Candidatus Cybelea sp.]
MTNAELKDAILTALGSVAPEMVAAEIDPKLAFRDQIDIDSMDFLNFIIALHQSLGLDVPESDYPRLSNLDGAMDYLAKKLGLKSAN